MARTGLCACLILALIGAGCSDDRRRVTVGSKNFLEQVLLGKLIAQHVERRLGVTVDRRLNLGGTMLAHRALLNGDIDLYPEYTGTALTAVLALPPSADARAVRDRVKQEYEQRYGLQWLDPLGFENTFAMIVRRADAERDQLKSLSDAAHRAASWTMGVGYEFQQRPDGLPRLLETYALKLTGPPTIMDLGLLYRALEQRQVNMIAGNSTDGPISVFDVTVLRDDRQSFPAYEAAIVVRPDSLDRVPGLSGVLNELTGRLSEDTMRRLNHQAVSRRGQVADVAREFLNAGGVVP
ncbi:MAG: ABC transporter substrate-binding protein [Nitrospira sp. WS110]|nr:ABC transporter substrate-binding protein [Nitrospira sp. WS110]